MIRYQEFIFFRLLETLLDLWIVPIGSCIQDFEINDLQSLRKRDCLNAGLVGHIYGEHDAILAENVWMYLKVNRIDDPPVMAGYIFHWVIGSETKMNVLI